MKTYRLLHVEDSQDDAELVARALREAPFHADFTTVEREAEYVAAIEACPPDLVICDYNLPQFSAERALALLRERGLDVPFIIVSHHIGGSAAVVAMQNGASDYLPKRDLGRLGKAIESAMDRCESRRTRMRVEQSLRESESMMRGVLDSLGSRLAVLDSRGVVVAVNRAWSEFQSAGSPVACAAREGANYLDLLAQRAAEGDTFSAEGLEELLKVMAGRKSFASLEYQVSVGETTRWYLARATPFQDTGGAVVTHSDITDRMMSRLVLEDANRRMQTLSRRVLAVQEEERRTISRELYGDLGDSLSALKMGLHRLADGEAAPRSTVLAECLAAADASLDRLRTLAHELRPPQLDQLGLPEALDWLARTTQDESGLAVQCRVSGLGDRRVPAAIENACYRVAQEGLRNALRQGQARHVGIELDADGRTLKLSIHHDGPAQGEEALREAAERPPDGGLISMEERVRLAGGRLKTRSVAGAGTVLSVFFPLAESAHA